MQSTEKGVEVEYIESLSEWGYEWALRNQADSLVARVALSVNGRGPLRTWPESHATTAIEACNAKGRELCAEING